MDPIIRDKTSLMAAIEASRAEILAAIAGLAHDALSNRRDAAGWTAADHLAHLVAWERSILFLLNGESRYEGLQIERQLLDSGDFDRINSALHAQTQGHAAEAIIARWHNVHEQLMAKLQPLSEKQMAQTTRSFNSEERRDDVPLYAAVASNTVDHFIEHLPQIRQLIGAAVLPQWTKLQPATALARLQQQSKPFMTLFRHGSLEVEIYKPDGVDKQQPHSRDEIYVIITGVGTYRNGDVRVPFATGDVLFAAAGDEHRFENFSDDFCTWVFFYGPEGGEAANDA